MQLTSQTRLTLPPAASAQLDAYAQFYAKLLHLLYAQVAARGGKARDHKTEFSRKHGISARLFNALAVELQGIIDGTRELLKLKIEDTHEAIKVSQRALKKIEDKLAAVAAKKVALTRQAYDKLIRQAAKRRRKLHLLAQKLPRLQERLVANVPGICFGSRKLFAKQYHLAENGFKNHDEWKAAWQEARAHQVAFLGSKTETAGNQACSIFRQEDRTYHLRVRLPDAHLADGQDKYLWLKGLKFHDDEPAIRAALERGQALSYKLHRQDGHWRLLVSFLRQAAPVTTLEAKWGCIGVDFNADHLGVAQTDPSGNIVKVWRVELPFEDKSSGQRKALLSDALQKVVLHAKEQRMPVVIEDLDFKKKKKQLGKMTAAQARALSGLAYAQYQQLMASKCFRFGVELLKVNPAYTSVAGRLKYAVPYGRSVHLAAAGVIARRGQGLTEKPPSAESVRIPVRGATQRFPLPARKEGVNDAGAWKAIGRDLKVFLRKDYLATRNARTAGAKGRIASGFRARRPSDGTVPARTQIMRSLEHEQVCGCLI